MVRRVGERKTALSTVNGKIALSMVLASLLTATGVAAAHAAPPPARYAVLDRIAGPDGGGWDYATIDTAARRLYLARDSGVLTLDLKTGRITPIAIPGVGVHSITLVGNTGLAVSTNGGQNSVSVFATRTGKVVGHIYLGASPDISVFDPRTRLVAVVNHDAGTISLVDAARAKVVRTIVVGGVLEAAAASGRGRLFVNVADKHEVAVLDLTTGKVVRRIVMKACADPSGIAYDSADRLIASVCGNGVTKILRAADGTEVASLQTGLGSDGLIFDAARKRLFVPAGRDGKLTVIRLSADKPPEVLQTLTTAPSVRLGALDTKTGRLYLPMAKLGPPVAPNPWPSVLPGTFALLVVGEPAQRPGRAQH